MFDFDELEDHDPAGDGLPRKQPPPLGRKLRVLALHGGGSNTNIMRYQTSQLRRLLGDSAEWEFLNGTRSWNEEPDAMMKAIADGMPFKGWYGVSNDDTTDRPMTEKLFDMSVNFTYSQVEEGAEQVLEFMRKQGPFDVLVGFSQGCIVTHLITGLLREKGEELPWRLSVLFNGLRVRDQRYSKLFEKTLSQPSLMIFGKNDPYYAYGKQSQMSMYDNPVVLEHDEGHKFPTNNAAGKEIYSRVVKEMLWHCGVQE